jgi:excisionase family DNA binding protein
MRYDGDVIQRLDRIESALGEVIVNLRDGQDPVNRRKPPQARVLLKVSEAAEQLGISRSSLYQVIAAGGFPSVRIGRSVRIPYEDMIRWIRSCGNDLRT